MRKILLIMAFIGLGMGVHAQDNVTSIINAGNTNITDATVVVPGSTRGDWTRLTDVAASSDGSTVGKLLVAPGALKLSQTVTNMSVTISVTVPGVAGGGPIFTNAFAVLAAPSKPGGYEAFAITNINSTNIVLTTAPTSNQIVGSPVWITSLPIERWPVPNVQATNGTAFNPGANVYLPGGDVMSVLRVTNSGSANTKLSVSGYRFNR